MAHVGVQRLAAGQGQEYAAQHDEQRHRTCNRKTHCLQRIECFEDRRRRPDVDEAKDADDDEPHHHDRAEQAADAPSAAMLEGKKPDQDDERRRHDEGRGTRAELQALDRGKHGDRRRYDAVAIKQSGADDTEQQHDRQFGPLGRCMVMLDQRQQRQYAALAVIVGAQYESDILHRNERHERPEGKRNDAQHLDAAGRVAGGRERDRKGIERTRSNIAEDDAERRQCQKRMRRRMAGGRPVSTRRPRPCFRVRRGANAGIRGRIHPGTSLVTDVSYAGSVTIKISGQKPSITLSVGVEDAIISLTSLIPARIHTRHDQVALPARFQPRARSP